jgi:hypothetical protein
LLKAVRDEEIFFNSNVTSALIKDYRFAGHRIYNIGNQNELSDQEKNRPVIV